MVTHHKLKLFMVFFLMFGTFYGCGGGGGDDSNKSSSNIAPVADAGTDQTVRPGTQVNLDGSSSRDADGTIVSYQWQQPPGTTINLVNADTANAQFTTPTTNGELVFQLTVTDDDGAQASDLVTITVSDTANNTPVADAGSDQIVQAGAIVNLDGSSSTDNDGTIATFLWEQIGTGTIVTLTDEDTATPSFIAPNAVTRELLTFQLTVQDDDGAQSKDTVAITINVQPTADAGAAQTFTLAAAATRSVTLVGTSSDSDGTIVSEQWVQIAGIPLSDFTATDNTATFTVDSTTQTYTFSYTVNDNDGAQRTDTVLVSVAEIIFSDGFANDLNWTTINENSLNTMDWNVVNGQLRQEDFLPDVALDGALNASTSYHVGTYAYLTDAISGVSDYRFSVDVHPLPDGVVEAHTEGNDVGIMFRRQDANNYYRVSMNAKYGFTRFEKRSAGGFETLAVNAIGYVDDQVMTMTAEVSGNTFLVWIDGDPVFAVVDDSPISSGTVALYCQDVAQFGNVEITDPHPQPTIAISTPLAYSVALTPDDGTTALSAEAVVLNAPTDASVVFTLINLDDITETTAIATITGSVHSAQFPSVVDAEYEIIASLMDADGQVLDLDTNTTVGIGGDYYVTIGDSITNGMGDEINTNNDSTDGRIVARQGYQAILSDDLTTTTGLPQVVFNEGIEGDTSLDLSSRIDSILERHPKANKVLLMIGTNDSSAPVDADDFETRVTNITTAINGADKAVWIAEILPTNVVVARNTAIMGYNIRIRGIANGASDNIFLGPDLYTAFDGQTDRYANTLHPNDYGYQLMAEQWHDILP